MSIEKVIDFVLHLYEESELDGITMIFCYIQVAILIVLHIAITPTTESKEK